MDRRTFIGTLIGSLLTMPPAARAQQTGKVSVVGVLSPQACGERLTFAGGRLESDVRGSVSVLVGNAAQEVLAILAQVGP